MTRKPAYEELEQRVKALERDAEMRMQAQEALREREERYRDLCEHVNDLIQAVGPDGHFIYVNRAWRETLGYHEEEVAELTLFDIIHPNYRAHCEEIFRRVLLGQKADKVEALFVAKNGREIIVEGSINCRFKDGKPISTRAIFRDMTERKRMEEKLRLFSYLDGLTGVANRRHFDETLSREWRRMARDARPLSLIMCDIDFFKAYNDTYGHLKGDECLKQVARTLSKALQRPGDTVARYGGEEFAGVLPGTDEKGGTYLAETLRARVESLGITHSSSQVSSVLTISVGVATAIPEKQSSPPELISMADQALYKAKREGRNRVCVFG